MKKLITAAALAVGATAAIAPAVDARPPAASPSIVETALAVNGEGSPFAGVFDTLIAAVTCPSQSGVLKVLSSRGQHTVFAPTDDAFAALGLSPDNVCGALPDEVLSDVLSYHVAKGRRDAGAVLSSTRIRMLNGEFTSIDGGAVTIDGNNIIVTDVPASNGIIHAIDGVLLPSSVTG